MNAGETPEETAPTIALPSGMGSLTPGQSVTITGKDFDAELPVEAWFLSTPTRVATATTDSTGGLRLTFTVPLDAEAAPHHVQIRAADGTVLASLAVTVTRPAAVGDQAAIAATGANIAGAVLVALLALACGIAFPVVSRRRTLTLP